MATVYKKLVEKQRGFFATGVTRNVDFRIKSLKKLRLAIQTRNEQIAEALKKDFGKCEFETFATEIMGTLDEIDLAIKNLHRWTKARKVISPLVLFKSTSRIYCEPFGSVLVISAWNYPFQLAMIPLVGALAAGNCCILKPSELSPHTSVLLAEIIQKCFDEAYCAVVEGGVNETTSLINERFDFIHYTGSTRVGKVIALAAAKYLTPVVLEMGGKSPCIVDETADIELSAKRIVWGKFLNAGQTCVAPDYLLVKREVKEVLVKALVKQIKHFYGDDPILSPDYCRIINQQKFDRLAAYLEEGHIICGGKKDRVLLSIEPTLIDELTWDSMLMQDEIFGPVLPVMEYDDLLDVIGIINGGERPLALYFFSKNKKDQQRIIKEVSFGGGCINATVLQTANMHMPFGGVGNSGMGYYHGKWSFEAFSHKKSILNKSLLVDFPFLYPPYKDKVKLLKKFFK